MRHPQISDVSLSKHIVFGTIEVGIRRMSQEILSFSLENAIS